MAEAARREIDSVNAFKARLRRLDNINRTKVERLCEWTDRFSRMTTMSQLSWVRILNGRFATAVRFIGDQVVVSIAGERVLVARADWMAAPLAI
jgi:hypothetical protein